NRKLPACRSSRLPNTLGASKRGIQSQPIPPSGATSAPVWQLDKNAKSAIGGDGEGGGALCSRRSPAPCRAGGLFSSSPKSSPPGQAGMGGCHLDAFS